MSGEPDFVIPPDHPALPGHVLAALARRVGPVRVSAIPQAKFLAPLAPGEPCTIAFPVLGPGEARFECTSGARVIARGTLRLEP